MTRAFLCTYLPPLTYQGAPPIDFERLMVLFEMNLSKTDLKKIARLRQYFDVQNVKLSLLDEKIDKRGSLDRQALKAALFEKADLPESTVEILEEDSEVEGRLRRVDEMMARFLQEMEEMGGILGAYAKFERGLRAIFTAWRAKKRDQDVEKALSFENTHDPVVMDLLSSARSDRFDVPREFSILEESLANWGEDPTRDFDMEMQIRFDWLKEKMIEREFTFDWIACYTLQLILIENRSKMNKARGSDVVDTILKDSA